MKNTLFITSLLALLVLALALPSFAAAAPPESPGASDCGAGYGQLHKGLATSGATGQGPNRGGHVPGQAHGGAAGICGVGSGR